MPGMNSGSNDIDPGFALLAAGLHEALTAPADLPHLALVFGLSHTTAGKYTLIASDLLADQSAEHQDRVLGEPGEIAQARNPSWVRRGMMTGVPAHGQDAAGVGGCLREALGLCPGPPLADIGDWD